MDAQEPTPQEPKPQVPQPDALVGDPAKAAETFKQFHEWYRIFIDDQTKQVDKGFELNKQIAAFNERLLLIDLGTLGLSVTALTSLASKLSVSLLAKHTFAWLVVPAWILLLLSVFFCRMVISHTLLANKLLFQQWNKTTTHYNVQMFTIVLRKLASVLSGTLTVESIQHDVSQLFSERAELIQKHLAQEDDALQKTIAVATGNQPYVKFVSWAAVGSMQFALILLCISAIRLFLAT